MNAMEIINEYSKLLDDINVSIARVDEHMGTLIGEYEKLTALHERVATDAALMMTYTTQEQQTRN